MEFPAKEWTFTILGIIWIGIVFWILLTLFGKPKKQKEEIKFKRKEDYGL